MARFTQSGGEGGAANTGDITFNGVQIIGAGNASSDGLNAGTMQLVPDAGLDSDQYLIIDPTAPNHIHIRAGGTLDASTADLIMGGENTNLLVSDTGDYVDIRTTSSENFTNLWRFNSDGLLVGPSMGSVKVSGLYNDPGNDLYLGSADGVVITGTDGEFLNDSSIPGNQIATIGNITKYYGSFYHTETVSLTSATTAYSIPLNTTAEALGVSIASNSRITVANAGVYNIQFSLQLDKTDGGSDVVNVWLSKNNSNVAWSNTQFTVTGGSGKYVAALNLFVTLAINDYVELKAQSPDTHMRIVASGTQANPDRPAVPSSIVTINQIS
jgi:hypothetical protein